MHIPALKSAFVLLLVLPPDAAKAIPITWTLAARNTSLPASFPVPDVGGTFTYDAATGQMLDWNFHYGIGEDFGTIVSSDIFIPLFVKSSRGGEFAYAFINLLQAGQTDVTLVLPAPLTDAGGVMPLITGDLGSRIRTVGGLIAPFDSGSINSVPEPALGFYGCALLIAALAMAANKG